VKETIEHIVKSTMPAKPDRQFELLCPTCRRVTKQAHLEGSEFVCGICCEVHDLSLPPTNQSLQTLIELIKQRQIIGEKIVELSR
jgi:hypothetical protein